MWDLINFAIVLGWLGCGWANYSIMERMGAPTGKTCTRKELAACVLFGPILLAMILITPFIGPKD